MSRRARLAMPIACALALVTGVAAVAQAQSPDVPAGPAPGWAHRDGRVRLSPLGAGGIAGDLGAKLLIQDTYARWGVAYDEAQMDVIRSLFTPDALFEVAKGSGKAFVTVKGPDAIVASVASTLAQQHDQRRHAISNIIFNRLTRTEASTIAYGLVAVAADRVSLGSSVIYSGELRRGPDGQWRFSRLFVGMDGYNGAVPNAGK